MILRTAWWWGRSKTFESGIKEIPLSSRLLSVVALCIAWLFFSAEKENSLTATIDVISNFDHFMFSPLILRCCCSVIIIIIIIIVGTGSSAIISYIDDPFDDAGDIKTWDNGIPDKFVHWFVYSPSDVTIGVIDQKKLSPEQRLVAATVVATLTLMIDVVPLYFLLLLLLSSLRRFKSVGTWRNGGWWDMFVPDGSSLHCAISNFLAGAAEIKVMNVRWWQDTCTVKKLVLDNLHSSFPPCQTQVKPIPYVQCKLVRRTNGNIQLNCI